MSRSFNAICRRLSRFGYRPKHYRQVPPHLRGRHRPPRWKETAAVTVAYAVVGFAAASFLIPLILTVLYP